MIEPRHIGFDDDSSILIKIPLGLGPGEGLIGLQ